MSDHAPIRFVRTRLLARELDRPIITPNYRITDVHTVLVELSDEDGAVGSGYLWCFGRRDAQMLEATIRALAPALAGIPATATAVAAAVRKKINFFGFKGVSVFALSTLDLAVTDLRCRRRGLPLAATLHENPSPARVYWSGLFLTSSIPELLSEVDDALERGLRAVKLRVGAEDLTEDVRRIDAVHTHLSEGVTIMLDAVQRWDVAGALAAARAFAPYQPLWLEDPLIHSDYAGLADVVASSPVPIATGENEYLREGFEQLLPTRVPYLLADLQRVGGVTEWQAVRARARAQGASLTSHTYPHVAAHLCAAMPGEDTWVEYVPWWDDLVDTRLRILGGRIVPDERAGIGLHWDPDAVERAAVSAWIEHIDA